MQTTLNLIETMNELYEIQDNHELELTNRQFRALWNAFMILNSLDRIILDVGHIKEILDK